MLMRFTPNQKKKDDGKLADAELVFEEGPLSGMKLVGFAVWNDRFNAQRRVTFPSRLMQVNGERRSYALLRPFASGGTDDGLRQAILLAYDEYERHSARAGDIVKELEGACGVTDGSVEH